MSYDAPGPYVVVIPSKPMEVVGIFGSFLKAEKWAVDTQLVAWTACPVMRPDQGSAIALARAEQIFAADDAMAEFDNPPEYEPDDGEAERIAEVYADAAADLEAQEAGDGGS